MSYIPRWKNIYHIWPYMAMGQYRHIHKSQLFWCDPARVLRCKARVLFQEATVSKAGKAKPEAVHPQCLKERWTW